MRLGPICSKSIFSSMCRSHRTPSTCQRHGMSSKLQWSKRAPRRRRRSRRSGHSRKRRVHARPARVPLSHEQQFPHSPRLCEFTSARAMLLQALRMSETATSSGEPLCESRPSAHGAKVAPLASKAKPPTRAKMTGQRSECEFRWCEECGEWAYYRNRCTNTRCVLYSWGL